MALVNSLWVVFILLLFGLTIAALGSFQYQLGRDSARRTQALEAAQSALALSLSRLARDRDWGLAGESLSGPLGEDVSYRVSFDPAGLGAWSLNNLGGNTSEPGYRGQVAPPYTALLFCHGRAGNRSVTVQAVVRYAPFPYAVAAKEQVIAGGGPVTINGLDSLSELTAILLGSDPGEAANMYAGSARPDAIVAGGGSHVSGEVRTPGAAIFGPGSVVVEGITAGAEAESVPVVDIAAFNNAGWDDVTELAPDSTYTTLSGPCYVNGDITLDAATLTNAYLYVDGGGNLISLNGLGGTGTIFVTGEALLSGNLNVVASNGIAIFGQRNLDIDGGTYFQGVMYSHGDIHVRSNLSVVGAVVSAGRNIHLASGAKVLHFPEYTRFGEYSQSGMMGHLLNGAQPPMEVVFWREYP